MKPSLKNSYCNFPFYQIAVKSFGSDGTVKTIAPCCNMIGFKNPFDHQQKDQMETVQDYFFSESMQKLRQSMLKGEKPSCCDVCWKAEAQSGTSKRFESHFDFPENFEIDYHNLKLVTVDLSTGNNCNLRCRMCLPASSNKLVLDAKQMSNKERTQLPWFKGQEKNDPQIDYKTPKHSNVWKNFIQDPKDIRFIKVIGGEAMMTKEFEHMLQSYVDKNIASETTIVLNTNATKFNNKNMDLINQFKKVRMIFSIDATGKSYEYIRFPMTWDKLNQSVDTFYKKIKTDYEDVISTPIMIYNIHAIEDICLWAKNKHIDHVFLDSIHPRGRGIDIVHLPKSLVNKYYQKIIPYVEENYLRGPGVEYIKYMCKKSYPDKKRVLQEIRVFDRIRKQNYEEFLDEKIVRWLNEKK